MKHLLKLLTLVIVGAFVLNSCDDVPAPYPIPTTDANASQDNGTTGTDLATVNFVSGQGNWTIEDKSNNGIWSHDSQYGMKASAYKSGSKLASESWLLSPEIDLTNTTGAVMVVKEAINKIDAGDPNEMMSVLASTDNGTTWEVLTADARPAGTSWDMQEDKFDLSAYDGKKIKVAFKYVSTTESAGTWEISTIKIQGTGSATIEGSDTPTPTGTEVTCAQAVELINALADNGTSTETYSVTGYITEVIGSVSTKTGSPQQSFWLADTKDGGQVLQAYYANVPDGVSAFTVGSKVKITGQLTKYVKNDAVTPEIKNPTVEILEASDDGGDTDTPVDPAGTGTSTDPYNVAKIKQLISESNAPTGEIYIKGKISQIKSLDVSKYTRAQYYISDNGSTTNQFYVYNGLYLGGANFTANDQIKVGDDVVILGTLGTYQDDYQVAQNSKIVSLNGNTADDNNDNNDDNNGDNGDETSDTPVEGMTITSSLIVSGATGSVVLDTNKYGSQAVATTSTWYTFKVNGATFTGCRICIATEANGGGIQMQGNASDASKQGFITNVTPFKPISSIKLVFRTTSGSTYEPGFNLYVGTTTHPTGTAVTGDKETSESDGFKTYTYTYDVSSNNYTFFTIANDLVGALYLDQIVVETK